jgi:hypothetical protein
MTLRAGLGRRWPSSGPLGTLAGTPCQQMLALGAWQLYQPIEDLTQQVELNVSVFQHITSSRRGLTIAPWAESVFSAPSPTSKEACMPIEEEITMLAATGAAAVVTAMGTDAWQTVRAAIVRMYRMARPRQHEAIAGQLDHDASFVASAADGPNARAAVRQMWEARLAELLAAAPECAAELRALALPGDRPSLRVEQRNSAQGSGTVAAALLGNVYYYGHQGPGSAVPPVHQEPQDGLDQ